MNPRELREKRANLVKQAREILDKAEDEKRNLDAEEDKQYSKIMEDVRKLAEDAEMLERDAEVSALERSFEEEDEERSEVPKPETGGVEDRGGPRASKEYRNAFESYLRRGATGLAADEQRALQMDDDVSGGYLVPMAFSDRFIQALDNQVFIRQFADVQRLEKSESLGTPSLDADPDDAEWTAEIGTGSEDESMAFGGREQRPHPLAKRIKVSKKLLRASAKVEPIVRQRLAYKHAVAQENGYLNGDGVNKPLGLFVASSQGISTSRDVSADNTTTAMTFDGLQNVRFTLKGAYHNRAKWIFHRDGVKQLAKIKDNDGRYMWQDSVKVGQPDILFKYPVFMSEYAPNTFTTGNYVGIFGDFSFYWIVDALDMTVQRLVELYAETNQDGFIGRLESDGMPVLEEAFVRVQLA